MLISFGFFRLACTFCLVLLMSVLVFADTIRLKDGSIIKGKIVNFSGGRFTVSIGDGSRQRQMTFTAAEIESIQFDAPTSPLVSTNIASQTTNQTTKGDSNQNSAKTENSTVIKVGDSGRDQSAPVIPPRVITTGNNVPGNTNQNPTSNIPTSEKTTTAGSASKLEPIELNVKVLANNTANGWTNSGWVVRKGQRIRIVGGGRVSLGNGNSTTASGVASLSDSEKLLKNVATGALIAVIGDDNNEFIYVGAEREFVATRDGALFLGVNEGNLTDNSGTFDVKIQIDPNASF